MTIFTVLKSCGMLKKTILLIAVVLLKFCDVNAQNGATGNSGGNMGYLGYINYNAALGEDQQISNNSNITIGSSGNVDIYGALQIDNGSTLQLLSGAILNVYGDMTVNGTLAINSGATINYYGKTWTNGSLSQVTNNGTITGTPGNAVNFITPQPAVAASFLSNTSALSAYSGGTQQQNLDGNSIAMDIVMHVQNSQSINLINSDASVSGQLSFDVANGYVIANSNRFIFTATGSHTGASTDRYIQTHNSTGEVIKQGIVPASGSFTFPVGFNIPNDYTPVSLNVTQGSTDNYHVSVNDFSTSPPNENSFATLANVQRTWSVYSELNTTGATSSNLSFYHYKALEQNSYNDALSSVFQLNNAGNWRSKGYGCTAETTSTIGLVTYYSQQMQSVELPTCAGCSSALNGTYFTKSSCTSIVLAVNLLNFTATRQEATALLKWSTASGSINDKFMIERSADGRSWQALTTINGRGNTAIRQEYSYTDNSPLNGNNYYRIRQHDNSGNNTYSEIKLLKFEEFWKVSLYPNPATAGGTVELTSNQPLKQIRVMDLQGRTVMIKSMPVATIGVSIYVNLSMAHLPAGNYLIEVANQNDIKQSIKLVKIN